MSFPSNDSPNGTTEANNEGFETALNITPAVKDEETNTSNVNVDDLVDADLVSSSAAKKSNKKPKKKNTCLSVAGVAKATLAVLAIGGTIGVIAGLLAPNRGGTSTQLQVAKNSNVGSPKSPKSGGRSEFEVCVVSPVANTFFYLVGIGNGDSCGLDPLDQDDFKYAWKKYTRRCNDFWGSVFFSIKYITVYFVNNVVCPSDRGLEVASEIAAPLTRALQASSTATGIAALLQQAIMSVKGILDSVSAGAGVPSNMEGTTAMMTHNLPPSCYYAFGEPFYQLVDQGKKLSNVIDDIGIDELAENVTDCVIDLYNDGIGIAGDAGCSASDSLYKFFNCEDA